ncbi:MAG: phosphatidylinositol-specific phospholipase C/glycerophosphodiester phosphodiesterase family protein [Phycisphaeraceae bacterium]
MRHVFSLGSAGAALFACILFVACAAGVAADEAPRENAPTEVVPLNRAFAHNDYYHARPLFDALDRGFMHVETDLFRIGDELLVAHSQREIEADRTLQSLYLDPLLARVRENDGRVYPGESRPFWLMIDFKTVGHETWPLVHEVLAEYAEMLTVVRDGELEPGPVRVVISGSRPIELMRQERVLYAGVDGRISDLQSNAPPELMPWISDNWYVHFHWTGEGEMPEEEREKLSRIVEQVHAAGRRLRFWATPERPALWRVLLEHDVDMLNTDRLEMLQQFLLEAEEQPTP